MPPNEARFTIRWLMETTAIVAIALSVLLSSAATWLSILILLMIYFFGLSPMRRMYGFAPVRRYFARWASGYVPVSQVGGTREGRRWS
jgi:hypothetical protein